MNWTRTFSGILKSLKQRVRSLSGQPIFRQITHVISRITRGVKIFVLEVPSITVVAVIFRGRGQLALIHDFRHLKQVGNTEARITAVCHFVIVTIVSVHKTETIIQHSDRKTLMPYDLLFGNAILTERTSATTIVDSAPTLAIASVRSVIGHMGFNIHYPASRRIHQQQKTSSGQADGAASVRPTMRFCPISCISKTQKHNQN